MKKTKKLLAALICVYLMTVALAVSAYADYSGSCIVGQPISQTAVLTTEKEMTAVQPSSGQLPSGMQMTNDSTHIYVSGTPSATGSFQSSYFITTEDGIQTFNLTINVLAAATPTPGTTLSPTATPKPTAAATVPKITKHPSGETVQVGGSAKFISRAENATKHVWRIVSADTTETVPADQAPAFFAGLKVSGTDTDTLVLSNIPKSMDKWAVECKFSNAAGDSFSKGAVIRIKEAAAAATTAPAATNKPAATSAPSTVTVQSANITTQPVAVTGETGKSCTLTVGASSPDGGSVSYQWYSSPVKNLASLSPVSGATSSTYTPPQTEGTVYYCAGVINTKDGKQSSTAYSEMVPVSYPAADPTPTPSIAPFPSPSPSAVPEPADNNGGILTTVLFFVGLGLLTIVAIAAILIYIRHAGKKEDGK